jgi:hypothetical protein
MKKKIRLDLLSCCQTGVLNVNHVSNKCDVCSNCIFIYTTRKYIHLLTELFTCKWFKQIPLAPKNLASTRILFSAKFLLPNGVSLSLFVKGGEIGLFAYVISDIQKFGDVCILFCESESLDKGFTLVIPLLPNTWQLLPWAQESSNTTCFKTCFWNPFIYHSFISWDAWNESIPYNKRNEGHQPQYESSALPLCQPGR